MNRFITLSALSVILSVHAHAQNRWQLVTPTFTAIASPAANEFVVTTNDGYLYRSINSGSTWTSQLISANASLGPLCFHGRVGLLGLFSGSVLRTTDGGMSWKEIQTPTVRPIYGIALPSDTAFFVSDSGQAFRSIDGGLTWNKLSINIGTDLRKITLRQVAFADAMNGWIGGDSSILLRTTDAGTTWTKVGIQRTGDIRLLTCSSHSPNTIAIEYFNLLPVIGVTSDGGDHWNYTILDDPQKQVRFDIGAMVFLDATTVAAFQTVGLSWQRTTDLGKTWNPQSLNLNGQAYFELTSYNGIAFDDLGHGFAVGSNATLYELKDLGASSQLARTFALNNPAAMEGCDKAPRFIHGASIQGGGYSAFITSSDGGSTWRTLPDYTKGYIGYAGLHFDDSSHGVLIANTTQSQFTTISTTTDDGISWQEDSSFPSVAVTGFGPGRDGKFYLSAVRDAYVSDSSARRWTKLGSYSNWLSHLQGFGDTLYALSALDKSLMLYSTNGGTQWDSGGSLHTPYYIRGLTFLNSRIGYAVGDSAMVLRTDNGGVSWAVVQIPMLNPSLLQTPQSCSWDVVRFNASGKTGIIAGFPGVLLLTFDSGKTWRIDSIGSPFDAGSAVDDITFSGDSLVILQVHDAVQHRLYRSIVEPPSNLQVSNKGRFTLDWQYLRTYPNPFSQSTTISFTPESSGHADVSIVNLLGVEVARIFSGELAAGEHSFMWDAQAGTRAPQGMYECLIRMKGRVETLPVMLLR